MKRITAEMCVAATRDAGKAVTAQEIAAIIGDTTSRSVATALRNPLKDGRVKAVRNRENWKARNCWTYRFVRLTAKKGGAA